MTNPVDKDNRDFGAAQGYSLRKSVFDNLNLRDLRKNHNVYIRCWVINGNLYHFSKFLSIPGAIVVNLYLNRSIPKTVF